MGIENKEVENVSGKAAILAKGSFKSNLIPRELMDPSQRRAALTFTMGSLVVSSHAHAC